MLYEYSVRSRLERLTCRLRRTERLSGRQWVPPHRTRCTTRPLWGPRRRAPRSPPPARPRRSRISAWRPSRARAAGVRAARRAARRRWATRSFRRRPGRRRLRRRARRPAVQGIAPGRPPGRIRLCRRALVRTVAPLLHRLCARVACPRPRLRLRPLLRLRPRAAMRALVAPPRKCPCRRLLLRLRLSVQRPPATRAATFSSSRTTRSARSSARAPPCSSARPPRRGRASRV